MAELGRLGDQGCISEYLDNFEHFIILFERLDARLDSFKLNLLQSLFDQLGSASCISQSLEFRLADCGGIFLCLVGFSSQVLDTFDLPFEG